MPLTDKTFSQCQPCWGFKPANQIFPKLHVDSLRRCGMKEDGVKDKWVWPRRKEVEESGQSRPFGLDHMQFCFHSVESGELSSKASVRLVGAQWEKVISPGTSCQTSVILLCHHVMLWSPYTGGTKTLFKRELLIQRVFLPLHANSNSVLRNKL